MTILIGLVLVLFFVLLVSILIGRYYFENKKLRRALLEKQAPSAPSKTTIQIETTLESEAVSRALAESTEHLAEAQHRLDEVFGRMGGALALQQMPPAAWVFYSEEPKTKPQEKEPQEKEPEPPAKNRYDFLLEDDEDL